MTKLLGVIGYPAKQSLSAVFQQAAFDALGLDLRYEVWPTPPERLAEVVQGLRAPDRLGANVTIPHKETVVPMMDETDELVRRLGAVNTIVNREGRLYGHNTDAGGFLRALREDGGFDPAGARVLVAGAGGAARAVVIALADAGAPSITIINRTFPRAGRLVEELQPHAGDTELHALPDVHASWMASVVSCRLLINCTSVGMAGTPEEKDSPLPIDLIPAGALVFDLIYRPPKTRLMAAAEKRGSRVLGGLPMLVYQGAESFRLWTGAEPPLDVMFKAARSALGGKAA
ncbi:MAG TPA: shikimate dehydrogenase [Methylomirabilota bacterium]|nr:shikimate dehydrogenase [Methylomirabilota bacterium]